MTQHSISAAEFRAQANEHSIQARIMSFLDSALPATYRAFAVPNGGKRDRITGAILKREGVKAGVPDIVIVRQGGSVGFLEVKTATGSLSNSQRDWRDWCGVNRVPFAVVRGVGDVQAALHDWGIPVETRAV